LLSGLAGCGSNGVTASHAPHDAGSSEPSLDASLEASADAAQVSDASDDVDKSATCVEDAAAFGSALTSAFGRVDGTVVAVVPPGDEACALPNSTHLIIEVRMQGAIYRMVVDVLSNTSAADSGTDVFFYEEDAPLQAGAWAEGWYPGVVLDYAATMGLHSTQFAPMTEGDLVAKITSEIAIGAHVSVFATSGGGETNSAHLVHRNLANQDGAIVINPETAPHYLLMRFAEDSF
jgi:hypothetical protein